MKKFIVAILTLVMLLSIAAVVSAEAKSFTIYNVPCEAIADSELYRYHGDQFVNKYDTDGKLRVKHYVEQSDADETNRIAAYREDTRKTMGASWKPADYTYYFITSNAIVNGFNYTAAARGNTNYATNYGLTAITIKGVIHDYDD